MHSNAPANPGQHPSQHGYTKTSFWHGENHHALFTWLYLPDAARRTNTGVVLCPPVGHEYVHCHRSYRYLAEMLAEAGITVLRFDYYGTGDSSGTLLDSHVLDQWQQNIATQLHFLRELGHVQRLGLFGVRLGASLALLTSAYAHCDFAVVWKPIVSGTRYVRELRAVSRMAADNSVSESFFEAGGFPISHELEHALRAIDLGGLEAINAEKLLHLVGDNDLETEARLFTHVEPKTTLQTMEAHGYDAMMDEPQTSTVPLATLQRVVSWVAADTQPADSKVKLTPPLLHQLDGEGYVEDILTLHPALFAIGCRPPTTPSMVLILANSGAVHHVGPNRLYVEMSRALAQHGVMVVRMDLSNLGDSATRHLANENHTYPTTATRDAAAMVQAVKTQYPNAKLILGGVCSGAHTAFHTAQQLDATLLSKVLIINPLTFYWRDGMSLEIPSSYQVNSDAKHYEGSLKSKESWKKLFTGKVDYLYLGSFVLKLIARKLAVAGKSMLQQLGLAPKTRLAKDLAAITTKGIAIDFIFATRDPGLNILMEEGGHGVKKMLASKAFGIHLIDQADHTFSKAGYRHDLRDALIERCQPH